MMNKKLIALFVAMTTVGAISADCYVDRYGNDRCDGVVRETGYVAKEAVATPVDVGVGVVAPIFGGRGVRERIEDRHEAQDERRARRAARREARQYRD